MAAWPATIPAPQKNISIVMGDTRVSRKLQSGRNEFRRFGDGKPDQVRVLFRLLWSQWTIFKHFYARDLNAGLNWFSASWLATMGYSDRKAKFLGYPREVARQGYYVDVSCVLIVQKTAWIATDDTVWPCLPTGGGTPPIEGFSYVYGGYYTSYLQDCDQFDPNLNVWSVKANMLSPARGGLAASTIGGSGYVYGGSIVTGYLQDCDQYTPDTWTPKTNMLNPARSYLAASTIGNSGYVYGGVDSSKASFQDCDQYTPNVWASKTDMPAPARHGLAASTIGGSGYIYGVGQNCDEYTPDTWTVKTDMPSPYRRYLAASTINSAGYVYGGQFYSFYQDCDEYTPDTWVSKTDMPSPARSYLAASTIDSSGYVYGGKIASGSALTDCDQYTPDAWTSKTDMFWPLRYGLAASTL